MRRISLVALIIALLLPLDLLAQKSPPALQVETNPPSTRDVIKTYTEIAAYGAGALFFIYKLIDGYLIVNLSLSGNIRRVKANQKEDDLVISATVKKGSNGTLKLRDGRAQVSYLDESDVGREKEVPFIGIQRLSLKSGAKKSRSNSKSAAEVPFLYLAPEEEATFSCNTRVPSAATCVIRLAFIGTRTWSWKVGQWRTSLVSLPCSEPATGATPDVDAQCLLI
jgi:hypothetical protein